MSPMRKVTSAHAAGVPRAEPPDKSSSGNIGQTRGLLVAGTVGVAAGFGGEERHNGARLAQKGAVDACYLAIGLGPSDPDLHLLLAELYLDRSAADRLAGLNEGARERERIEEVACWNVTSCRGASEARRPTWSRQSILYTQIQ